MASMHSEQREIAGDGSAQRRIEVCAGDSGMHMVGLRKTNRARREGRALVKGSGGSSEGRSPPTLRLADRRERGPEYGCAPLLRQVGLLHDCAAGGVDVCVG